MISREHSPDCLGTRCAGDILVGRDEARSGGKAMVEELRQAIAQAEQQPEDMQRHIAEVITLALEEQEWDALTSTPESQTYLAQLSREIDEQEVSGEVEEGGWEL